MNAIKVIELDGGLSIQLYEVDDNGKPEVFLRISLAVMGLVLDSAYLPNEPVGIQIANETAALLNANLAITANLLSQKEEYELEKIKLEVQLLKQGLGIFEKEKPKKKKRKNRKK